MKSAEFRKLIAEEVKKALNEGTYPINVSEITCIDKTLVIVIGNSRADLIGYKPEPTQMDSINKIMKSIDAYPFKGNIGGTFSAGQMAWGVGSVSMEKLIDAANKIKALNIVYSY